MTDLIGKVRGRVNGLRWRAKQAGVRARGLPQMNPFERRLMRAALVSRATGEPRVLKFFEWGSGRSTLYFGKWLSRRGQRFTWTAIENHAEWRAKVQAWGQEAGLDGAIQVQLHEFPPFWEDPAWDREAWNWRGDVPFGENAASYVEAIRQESTSPDIVLIDGRYRRRCLESTLQAVNGAALVILHDAERPHYWPGTKIYPHGRWVRTGRNYVQGIDTWMWFGATEAETLAWLDGVPGVATSPTAPEGLAEDFQT